jgi:hypothetical protein
MGRRTTRRHMPFIERAAIYEQDRLDPVEPSDAFDAMMKAADIAKFPAAYRYMAFRVLAAGRVLALPVHCDGAAETDQLYARYNSWLMARTGIKPA